MQFEASRLGGCTNLRSEPDRGWNNLFFDFEWMRNLKFSIFEVWYISGMDGHGMNGHGMDGRGMDGRGMDGRGMDGRGADFRGADLRGAYCV